MQAEDPVLLERHGEVALLSLNVPQRLNPIQLGLQKRLREHLANLREDRSVRALVITGEGKAFCVGADLSDVGPPEGQSIGQAMADTMEAVTNRMVEDLQTLPFPVVSAVNGPCAGAGVGLALAADVVVAARSAYFYLPFMPRLGIVPDVGCTWFLERAVGRARAVAMSLLDERLEAERAQQWGLVWKVSEDAELRADALALAQRLARLPAHAAQEIRSIYKLAGEQDLLAQLHTEAERQRVLLDRPSFKEGVDAFMNKRAPTFPSR
ncbi:enoyl-CoA hydratase-related protein [Variovorax dokdonensis]|uniref:Enoyl-CoA hydratase-related protein n=1 Tax=Variovorax dokdonensis TaxID=344883 RepID=A0ABT7N540_9BURK|nr:enoyl-CoA hydratase-related protein [Variovorax dokdonensis]MDM0043042.1 enoyl-CoA hydratase-related protein [Variovorax dokdonensis]